MRNRILCILLLSAVLASCNDSQNPTTDTPLRVDSMNLSEAHAELPELDGRELVLRYCVPCHSTRYIEMQPEMTRHSWEKTVTKMVKNFGAPVPDSQTAERIVDYLFKIKGKPSSS